jgi:putative ABC transport system permease protein
VPIAVDLGGDPGLVPGVLLLFTLVACLCSWWPARRAAAQPIVEALRHV